MKDNIKPAKALSEYKELSTSNQYLVTTLLQLYSALFTSIANIQNAQNQEEK